MTTNVTRILSELLFLSISLLAGCTGSTPAVPASPTVGAPARDAPGEAAASPNNAQAVYRGQDGASFAGQQCSSGTAADNIHIHLSGLREDASPTSYRLVDGGMGVWATPCDPQSNWLLFVNSTRRGEADLYFKPYQQVTEGTQFTLTIQYEDGSGQVVVFKAAQSTPADDLTAVFIGQDGQGYAGKQCSSGTAKDNVHIQVSGIRTDTAPVSYRVDEEKGGVWATPCDPAPNWFLFVNNPAPDQADLYFKPYRDAPEGTRYTITIRYEDGTSQTVSIKGQRVKP